MTRPVIGVTTLRADGVGGLIYHGITQEYIEVTSAAGAVPVMVPLGLPADDLDRLSTILDGLIITGGGDIDPAAYGAENHASVQRVDADRDRVEIHLARRVIDAGKPFLGVCRGMQVVNVALGGTLYTDILDQHPKASKHNYWPGYPRDRLAHPVQVSEGTRLAEITNQPILQVNSLHHQAVNRLADGLMPTAYAPDGILEAFEMPTHPFGLAVQWHPEWLPAQPEMMALFEALVAAARSI